MSKYIIRNCPAIKEITTLLTSEPPQFQKEWRCCTTGSNLKNCKDITDCLLKRVAEVCKEQNLKYDTTACSVLQLLEIEEV